ncbi:MAG: DNA mismatch repair endonuclease MutL [Clostridia bacterium]|nr:DNA mismatch repair endonuclease MutL [Clostridia bacterium]
MQHIHQLPPDVIGQIAAGEVVERPAAAIKELVENSMDAGATAITVDIRDGGITSFRVSDNGSGIAPQDIRLAFARHATSKIRTAEDLYGVRSLGFRGEALASIAAVSKVTCQTRQKGRETGVFVRNEGGDILEIQDAACPDGTSFTVKELFYNAPVRRKFLKKPASETAAVSDLIARLILSHPAVSFRFMADGKMVYFSAGDGRLESAVMSVYGTETLKLMTKIEGGMNGVLLSGFVGVGDAGRGNRSHEHFFLNGRAMKSPLLSLALENACRQRVTIGRFPMCVLHLTMPFENADVNVHPNKWEVRFQDEKGVREAVEAIVFDALQKTNEAPVIPPLFLGGREPAPARIEVTQPVPPPEDAPKAVQATGSLAAFTEDGTLPVFAPAARPKEKAPLPPTSLPDRPKAMKDPGLSLLPPKPSASKANAPETQQPAPQQTQDALVAQAFGEESIRILGVAFDTYIVMEYKNLLILSDQHAVHERLLYEKFMRETASAPASQALLIPLAVRLSKAEYACFEENADVLMRAGFDLAPFGGDTVEMRGVPMILGQPQAEKCLRDALDELIRNPSATPADRASRVIQMSCKHAVKGGERLPDESVKQLIRDVIEQKVTPTCPHGRPLMVQLSRADLEKRFRRIQS